MIKLWGHEILRVFHDRMTEKKDQDNLKQILNDILG